MNIKQIRNDYRAARQMNKAGDILNGARLALGVQQSARRSRSRYAESLAFDAHMLAASALYRGRAAGVSQPAMSELGQIAAASKFLLHRVPA